MEQLFIEIEANNKLVNNTDRLYENINLKKWMANKLEIDFPGKIYI